MQVNANSERLQKSHSELLELQLVLERAGSFFTDAQSRASTSTLRSGGNDGEQLAQAGSTSFEKRLLLGHLFIRFSCDASVARLPDIASHVALEATTVSSL